MEQTEGLGYDKAELRSIIRAFKAMDDEAVEKSKAIGFELATYAGKAIQDKAGTRRIAAIGSRRVADGLSVSKSSKIGEIRIGFVRQKFSGGATTQSLWPGLEFGSNRLKQFPMRTPREGRGNTGYFIYPALKDSQPYIVQQWENAFSDIVKKWDVL